MFRQTGKVVEVIFILDPVPSPQILDIYCVGACFGAAAAPLLCSSYMKPYKDREAIILILICS